MIGRSKRPFVNVAKKQTQPSSVYKPEAGKKGTVGEGSCGKYLM